MYLMLRVHDEAIAECGTCSHKEPGKDDAIGLVAFAPRTSASASMRYRAQAVSTRRQKADFVHFCEVAADTEFV
jgi:hypothetical protein